MLHILWMVLKIIGIILLAILGILILAVCAVLFVPVRYRLNADSHGDLDHTEVHVKASWLLHLLSVSADFVKKELQWKIKLGWKEILSSDEEALEKDPKEEKARKYRKKEPEIEDWDLDDVEAEFDNEMNVGEEDLGNTRNTSNAAKKKTKPQKENKIKFTIQKICDKIKSIIELKNKILDLWKDEITQNAFVKLKQELMRLAGYLKPKKICGRVRFGMEDPAQTGQALAILSVLYPFYGDHVSIVPEFYEKVLEGHLYVKGHIRGIHLLIVAWNLWFDKNIKKTIKRIKTWK